MEDLPIYWSNPELFETETVVTEAQPISGGWSLILEQPPFYPGGGGQPADRGTINGVQLTGIRKDKGNIVYEIKSDAIFVPGDEVLCRVDKDFRRDSMQQHTGQHLLSAALALEELDTVSVHLGSEYVGIEVEGTSNSAVSDETIKRVLGNCDRWISENHRVISRYLKPEELGGLKLRRPVKAESNLVRIIEMENLDNVGCGGVHLQDTASIGLILYLGSEKIRGRIRLKWLIGNRARKQAREQGEQASQLQKMLSAAAGEIPGKVDSLLNENQKNKSVIKSFGKEIGTLLADSWLSRAEENKFIVETIEIAEVGSECLEAAVEKISSASASVEGVSGAFILSGSTWIFYSREGGTGFFNDFQSDVLKGFRAKGGGKPPLWRGRIEGDQEKIISAVRTWISSH